MARAEAKRERAMAKRERQGLDVESDDELEPDSEAEFEADAPRATLQRWFDIKDFFNIKYFVDSSLPITMQKAMLEEMLQDINADIGVSTDDVERAALLDVHAQITAELGQLPAA